MIMNQLFILFFGAVQNVTTAVLRSRRLSELWPWPNCSNVEHANYRLAYSGMAIQSVYSSRVACKTCYICVSCYRLTLRTFSNVGFAKSLERVCSAFAVAITNKPIATGCKLRRVFFTSTNRYGQEAEKQVQVSFKSFLHRLEYRL